MRHLVDSLSIPTALALFPTVGFLVGWLLDRRLGTFPWLTVVLLVMGFIAAAREVWRAVRRSSDKRNSP